MAKYFTKPPIGTPLNKAHRLSQGLVGYWSFGEGAGGKTQDLSGNGNHGILTNIVQGATSGWAGGKFGRALNFDGVDDYVQTELAPSGYTAITMAAWVNLSAVGFYSMVLSSGTNADGVPEMRFFSDSGRMEIANRVNNVSVRDTVNVSGTGWHHFVGVANGTTLTLYKDGALVGSSTIAHNMNSSSPFRFARRSNDEGGTYFPNASLDEVRIYNRVLSADEVRQLYTDPFCMFEQESQYRWYVPSGAQVANGNFFQFM